MTLPKIIGGTVSTLRIFKTILLTVTIRMKFAVWAAAALFAPPLVLLAGMAVRNCFPSKETDWDWVILLISVITGIVCIWKTPASKRVKLMLTVPYIPLSICVLIVLAFWIECIVYGDCL